jgi:hypothetical protein
LQFVPRFHEIPFGNSQSCWKRRLPGTIISLALEKCLVIAFKFHWFLSRGSRNTLKTVVYNVCRVLIELNIRINWMDKIMQTNYINSFRFIEKHNISTVTLILFAAFLILIRFLLASKRPNKCNILLILQNFCKKNPDELTRTDFDHKNLSLRQKRI